MKVSDRLADFGFRMGDLGLWIADYAGDQLLVSPFFSFHSKA